MANEFGSEDYSPDFDLASFLRKRSAQEILGQAPVQQPQGTGTTISPEEQDYQRRAEALQHYRETEPSLHDPQYQPTKLGRLGGILGGAASAFFTRSPQQAMRTYQDIAYRPFHRAETEFGQGLRKMQYETDVAEQRAKEARATQLGTARVGLEGAQAELAKKKATEWLPTTEAEFTRSTQATKSAGVKGPYVLTKKDGSVIQGATYDPARRGFIDPTTGQVIPQDQVDRYETHEVDQEPKTSYQMALAAFKKAYGHDPQTEDELNLVKKWGEDPSALEYRKILEGLATVNVRKGAVEATRLEQEFDPKTIDYYADQWTRNPDLRESTNMDPKLRAMVDRRYTEKTGLPPPIKLNPLIKGLETSSRMSMQHAQFVREMLKDPEIQARIGAVGGRVGGAEQFIGETLPGLSPQAVKKIQEIRTRLKILAVQEARSASGYRPSNEVLKMLHDVAASPNMSVDMLLGALNGIEGNAKLNLQTVFQERYGVPGEGVTPEAAGQGGQVQYKNKRTGQVETIPMERTGPNGERLRWNPKTEVYDPVGR